MANNPYVNKVQFGNQTVMDISDTTATEGDVISGKDFYKANGAKATGTAVIPDISNCYQTTDTAETALADGDYVPFYDTSATAKRKTLWSNIKSVLKSYFDTLYSSYTGVEGLIKSTVGWSVKNILDCDITGGEHTKNGLTIWVSRNGNGSVDYISVNGTATADTYVEIASYVSDNNTEYLTGDTYILSGCPEGGGNSTYSLILEGINMQSVSDTGSGVLIANELRNAKAYIFVKSGYTASNLRFYPMIRNKNITDDTYEGHNHNNVITELASKYDTNDTAETTIDDADYIPFYDSSASEKRKTLWSNIKAKLKTYFDAIYRKEPHNYLVISSLVDNTTIADIAMTVQKNVGGQVTSITANGTTPSNKAVSWRLVSYNTFTLDAGTYILSGCPSGGSQNTYCLLIYGSSLNTLYDVGEGVEFTLDTEQNINVELIIRSNVTVSNKTFTPMIRRSGTSSSFSVGLYDDANLTYRMDGFSAIQTQSNGKVVFDNLNPDYGYDLYWYTNDNIDVDTSAMPYHTHVKKESGTQSGTMKLTYTIANGTNGTTMFALRIMKK